MRCLLVLCFLLTACGGSTTPDPNAQLHGNWSAVSLNGSPLPVDYTYGVLQIRAVYRHLTLNRDHAGLWDDSTQTTTGGVTYYSGHHNTIYWWTENGQVLFNAKNAPYTDFSLTFSIQGDESLLETNQDAAVVVYRR